MPPIAPARTSLTPEHREFIAELSITLQKSGMYPVGHPALAPTVASLAARAARLIGNREQLTLGVGPQQITIDGATTDPGHLGSRRLAEGIYRHGFGEMGLRRGVEGREIAAALAALAQDPTKTGALCARPASSRPSWPHLRLHPVAVERTLLPGQVVPEEVEGATLNQGETLWFTLARAALTDSGLTATSDRMLTDPSLVARALHAHFHTHTCSRTVVDALSDIAGALRLDTDQAGAVLRQRTTRLLRALGPETLARLILACGDRSTRQTFLDDAVHGLPADAVIDIVSAAAEASEKEVSPELRRVLAKLAACAEQGPGPMRPLADAALRDQATLMLVAWHLLAAPAPSSDGVLPPPGAATGTGLAGLDGIARPDPMRLVQISLEGGWDGPALERAIDEGIAQGHAAALVRLVATPGDHASAVRAHLTQPNVFSTILQDPDVDEASLHRLQADIPAGHYGAALQTLATTENRILRHRLLGRLAQAPVDLGDLIVSRLDDPRWFVPRNMLALLERSGTVPAGLDVARWTSHADVRVRQQAIRLWLQRPHERELAVQAAIADGHPRLVHAAIVAVQHECPENLAGPVSRIALDPSAEPELRILAAEALGQCPHPMALDTLLTLTDGGRTLLGRPKLPPRSPVTLAAVRGLAAGWRNDARADARVRLAEAATDADIRQAVEASHR